MYLIPTNKLRQAVMESINEQPKTEGFHNFLHTLNQTLVDELEKQGLEITIDSALALTGAQATIGAVLNFEANRRAIPGELTDPKHIAIPV